MSPVLYTLIMPEMTRILLLAATLVLFLVGGFSLLVGGLPRLHCHNSSCLEQGRTRGLPVRKGSLQSPYVFFFINQRQYIEGGRNALVVPPEFSSGGSRELPLHGFPRAINRLRSYFNGLASHILRIIPPLLLPVLLGLPFYYLSQASELLAHFDSCHSEYDQWIKASNSLPLTEASPAVDCTINGTDHHALVHNRNIASTALNGQNVTNGSPPHNNITPVTLPLTGIPPDSVVKLQHLWLNYVDSRVVELRILATTACVFVAWVVGYIRFTNTNQSIVL